MSLRELSTRLTQWRCERPDEWTMDEFISLAHALEHKAERAEEELSEVRRLLDEARKQEPIGWRPLFEFTTDVTLGDPTPETVAYWKEQNVQIQRIYAAPVPAQPARDDTYDECLRSLVRQVALLMDDCEEHDDGTITIDCDISQGFLRRIYDLLDALEDAGCNLTEPPTFVMPAHPAAPTYAGPCMCARDHCQNRTSMPHPTWKCRKEVQAVGLPETFIKDVGNES